MSGNLGCLLRCRPCLCDVFHYLGGTRVYSHESIQRPSTESGTLSISNNHRGKNPNHLSHENERRVVLKEDPPQADTAFRIASKFTSFTPDIATSDTSVGASKAIRGTISSHRQQKTLSRHDPAQTWQSSSASNKRSRSKHIALETDAYATEPLYAKRPAQSESRTDQARYRAEERPDSNLRCTGSDPQHLPHISSSVYDAEKVAKFSQIHERIVGEPQGTHSQGHVSVQNVFPTTDSEFNGEELGAIRVTRYMVHLGNNIQKPVNGKIGRDYVLMSSSKAVKNRFSIWSNVMPTPSDNLLAALPPLSRRALAPPTSNKTDLSYVAVRQWENASSRRNVVNGVNAMKTASSLPSSQQQSGQRISLSTILSRYLSERSSSPNEAVVNLHKAETMEFLRSKNYSVDDVLAWSRILSVSDVHQVVSRFIATADEVSSLDRLPLPTFLLMFIVRSKSMEASGLRLLLRYIWKQYVPQQSESRLRTNMQVINQQTALVMIVRLVRYARIVWPDGLEEIATLATRMIGIDSDVIVDLPRQSIQGFSHLFNRLLTLFSKPTSLRPFQSIALQQRCQFILIRKMTSFKPHLPVTREGFRALTKIQLAHKKTEAEKDWATSKALSWPPWKEELLGIEAGSEDPGRDSRAIDVLSRMNEAGYSHLRWEETARILAGWDTDNSPTIQTRSLLRQSPLLRSEDVKLAGGQSGFQEHDTWTARILATRTVKEAWACFTSYEKSVGESPTIEPYQAMFTRLLHAGKHHVMQDSHAAQVVPGDSKETWPEPISPHDFLYVPSEPPSISVFFEMMKGRGLRPGKRLLIELLDSAQTLEDGFKYIKAGRLSEAGKQVLLGTTQRSRKEIQVLIRSIGDRLVAAFVRLLCRAQATSEISFTLPQFPSSHREIHQSEHARDPFLFAQRLVTALQPSFKPIWLALFQGWNYRVSSSQPQAVESSWLGLLSQLQDMDTLGIDLDFDCFRDLGAILEAVAISSRPRNAHPWRGPFGASADQSSCGMLCKGIFNAMAYGGSIQSKMDIASTTSWLPTARPSSQDRTPLIGIPTPAVLHRTIRILGICDDYRSIITLLRWMHCFAPELVSVADQLANSKLLTRRAMAAVRYFFEQSWRDEHFDYQYQYQPAVRGESYSEQHQHHQMELLREAREIIELHQEDWGGWATDHELYDYHSVNKSKARRMRACPGRGRHVRGGPGAEEGVRN